MLSEQQKLAQHEYNIKAADTDHGYQKFSVRPLVCIVYCRSHGVHVRPCNHEILSVTVSSEMKSADYFAVLNSSRLNELVDQFILFSHATSSTHIQCSRPCSAAVCFHVCVYTHVLCLCLHVCLPAICVTLCVSACLCVSQLHHPHFSSNTVYLSSTQLLK